jgi:hypothetical protein
MRISAFNHGLCIWKNKIGGEFGVNFIILIILMNKLYMVSLKFDFIFKISCRIKVAFDLPKSRVFLIIRISQNLRIVKFIRISFTIVIKSRRKRQNIF